MATILTVGRAADGAALDGVLTAAGHRVARAGTALEAVARARGGTPDIVLVDGPFSARASSQLVARLRAEPATARLPIVLLEASSPVSTCLAALGQLGVDPARKPALHAQGEPGYRALFESSISGIGLHEIVIDPQGRPIDYVFLDVNPAFEELTGLRRERVVGRRATEVLPGTEQEALIEIFGRVALTGEAARFEQHSPPLDRYYDVAAFGWGHGRFAAVFTDVTEQRRADEQLRLQSTALEAAANAIVITDREGRITWANPAFTRLTGWSLDEAMGLSPRILKSGQHDPSFYEEFWRTILSGQVWQGEMVNRRKDGSFYYEEQTITPVRGPGRGEITHFVGVKVDVSERRAARESLLQSERRHRRLAEAAHDDIFIVDREGRVLYLNTAGATRLGQRPADVVGKPLGEVLPPEVAARFLRNVERVFASGEDLYVEERSLLNGREIWSGTWLTPLTGEGGGIESVEAVSRDTTTRVAAEHALRASEQRYRSLFERNLAGVYRTTLEGRIVECNDAFARVLGYASAAEVRGLSAGDLYPMPALRQAFVETLLSEGTLVSQESEGRRKDGAPVWMLENAALVREEGGPYIEGTIVDITERKKLERQLGLAQKMEAVGQLAGGVAHDFSNILNVIGGYSELAVKRSDEESPIRPYLDEIRRAAGRGTNLVRQLLAFSRGQIVEPGVLDLEEVVRGLEEMLRRLIPENIELVTSLRASPALVKADRGQLEQVIVNLAVNARDAMPRGGRLAIETTRTHLDEAYCRRHVGTSPGPHVMLTMTDTGIGMDAEIQARIFEPFFTTKEAGRGTGLGLATVYGIARRAGGSVWVYSEPGRGTVFRIYLPQAEGEGETAEAARPAEPAPGVVPGGTETILLVEDEEALRALARELLESLGYTVLEAQHGAEALGLSASHVGHIDLLMTDQVMPHIDGQELATRLVAERPETRVLFVSGCAEDDTTRGKLPESRVAFLQKPYTAAALGTKIRQLLDRP
jgi:PAS domain S-box-containing protein